MDLCISEKSNVQKSLCCGIVVKDKGYKRWRNDILANGNNIENGINRGNKF